MRRLALAVLFAGGCFNATIHLSPNPIQAPPTLPDAWHVSLFGVIELSDPVSLGVCPLGPNAIEENESILGALVAGFVGVDIMDTAVTCDVPPNGPPPPIGAPLEGPPGAPPPPPEAGY